MECPFLSEHHIFTTFIDALTNNFLIHCCFLMSIPVSPTARSSWTQRTSRQNSCSCSVVRSRCTLRSYALKVRHVLQEGNLQSDGVPAEQEICTPNAHVAHVVKCKLILWLTLIATYANVTCSQQSTMLGGGRSNRKSEHDGVP